MAIVDGWGRGTWGQGAWNENIPVELVSDNSLRLVINTLEGYTVTGSATVTLTGQELISTLESVVVYIDKNQSITGEQLTLALDSVSLSIDVLTPITGETLNGTVGEADPGPDVSISGIQVSMYVGDVSFTITGNVSLTGQELNTDVGNVDIRIIVGAAITGQNLNLNLNSVLATIDINASLTGQELNTEILSRVYSTLHNSLTATDVDEMQIAGDINLYNQLVDNGVIYLDDLPHKEYIGYTSKEIYTLDVDVVQLNNLTRGLYGTTPETHEKDEALYALTSVIPTTADANVAITGQELTLALGNVDSSYDAIVTGQNLNLDLNSVTIDLNTPVDITGVQLNLSLGSVFVRLGIAVSLTGNNLTLALQPLYPTAWAPVDTGQTVSYGSVNTGQTVNWSPVDTAA